MASFDEMKWEKDQMLLELPKANYEVANLKKNLTSELGVEIP